jgi:hypothetical protein
MHPQQLFSFSQEKILRQHVVAPLDVVYFIIIICRAKFKRQNVTCTIFALLIFKARVEELKETD